MTLAGSYTSNPYNLTGDFDNSVFGIAASGGTISGPKGLETVGRFSAQQTAAVALQTPIVYCNNPELHLDEAAAQYIPRACYEEEDAYSIRLSYAGSSFEPFYRALKTLTVGTALRKPIVLADAAGNEDWRDFIENCSLEGETLTVFAKRLLESAIDGGWAGILIDYPSIDEPLNRAQEKALALRPYFCMIPCWDVLGWQSTTSTIKVGSSVKYGTRLTQLRIRDTFNEIDPKDEFNEVMLPAVRVYSQENPDDQVRHRLYVQRGQEEGKAPEWVLEKESLLSINTIPFVPSYAGQTTGFMQARPPMLDVARLNISHWQASADLAHSLHLTATPTLVISGVQQIGDGEDISTSPERSLVLADPSADAKWIAASTNGAETILKRLQTLEMAMTQLSPVQLQRKVTSGVESASAKKIDRAQSDSVLSTMVSQLEDALNSALKIAGLYWQAPAPELELSRDFVPGGLEAPEVQQLMNMQVAGLISHETLLRKLASEEYFDALDEWSPEDELDRIQEETPIIDGAELGLDQAESQALDPEPAVTEPPAAQRPNPVPPDAPKQRGA